MTPAVACHFCRTRGATLCAGCARELGPKLASAVRYLDRQGDARARKGLDAVVVALTELLRLRREDLLNRDARRSLVEAWLADSRRATRAVLLADVMLRCLGMQPGRIAPEVQGQVVAIMAALGWQPMRSKWAGYNRTTRWVKGPVHGRGRLGAVPGMPIMEPPEPWDEPWPSP
jgi:hypothetical protein